jgi:hypothetical protein
MRVAAFEIEFIVDLNSEILNTKNLTHLSESIMFSTWLASRTISQLISSGKNSQSCRWSSRQSSWAYATPSRPWSRIIWIIYGAITETSNHLLFEDCSSRFKPQRYPKLKKKHRKKMNVLQRCACVYINQPPATTKAIYNSHAVVKSVLKNND